MGRKRIRNLARGLRRTVVVGAVGARHLAPVVVRRRRRRDRGEVAAAACRAAHALGSTYLKFGQIVASSPGLVGDDVAEAFRSCLDTGPPIPRDELIRAVERAAGTSVGEAYRSLDENPLGTASIAVVHRAETTAGMPVALKVRRPGVQVRVANDIRVLRGMALAALRIKKSPDAAQFLDLVEDFDRNIQAELDFSIERASIDRIGARLAAHGFERIAVPATFPELSDDGVLAMELFDGVAVDDLAGIKALGVDAGPLVDEAIRAWLVTSLVDGEFHADCHAGNVLVLRDGRLGLIDWGIVGVLDDQGRRCLVRLLEGGRGDDGAWAEVAQAFVGVFGDGVLSEVGATAEELPGVLRDLLAPLLNAPFGQGGLAAFMTAAKERSEKAAAAQGSQALDAMRRQDDVAATSFKQGFFLWMKQLVFFERYARLHGRTRSIADHAADVLPLVAGGGHGPTKEQTA